MKEVYPVKLLSPNQVAEITGLPYAKALTVIKSLAYTRIDHNYYISESKLREFLSMTTACGSLFMPTGAGGCCASGT